MRNFLLVTVAVSLAVVAAVPSDVSAQPCNPYTQGAWATRAAIPTPLVRGWGTFFSGQQRFYVLGGRQTDTAGSDYLNPREYDPVGDTWAVKAGVFPDNQVNNMVGGILNFGGPGDLIVVVGGSAAGATTATAAVRTYDPVSDMVTPLPADNWPGNGTGTILPGGGAVFNNRLYIFGGFNINVAMTNQIWEFNPAGAPGARWTLKAATLPAARGYIPTAVSGNFIYLIGGSDFVGGLLNDTNQSLRYDPNTDTITTIATTPRAVAETQAIRMPLDNTIWVLSGGRTPPNPVVQVDVYNPASDSWSTAPSILTPRRNFPVDVDPADGRIFAAGGYDVVGTTPLSVNEQFTCTVPVDLMTFGVE
jgi:hypothetical protein